MNETLVESYDGLGTLLIVITIALLIAATTILLLVEEFDQKIIEPWRKPKSLIVAGENDVEDHFIE